VWAEGAWDGSRKRGEVKAILTSPGSPVQVQGPCFRYVPAAVPSYLVDPRTRCCGVCGARRLESRVVASGSLIKDGATRKSGRGTEVPNQKPSPNEPLQAEHDSRRCLHTETLGTMTTDVKAGTQAYRILDDGLVIEVSSWHGALDVDGRQTLQIDDGRLLGPFQYAACSVVAQQAV